MADEPSDRDAPERIAARAAQADPWVMYLVVRQDVPASAAALLVAAAQATVRCADELAHTPSWSAAFDAWSQRSFRKVSLRARGSAWEKLAAYEAGRARVRGTEAVRALPPRLRSACGALLHGLQVFNPDPATLLLPSADEADATAAGAPAMLLAINPDAPMSLGKQVAQVAHAVLLCSWSKRATEPRAAEAFAAWRAAGYPCEIAPQDQWAPLRSERDSAVVRDAGLTEVAPGTETVLALPPGFARR